MLKLMNRHSAWSGIFMMKKGIAASGGYAIGNVVIKNSYEFCIIEKEIKSVNSEIERLHRAFNMCRLQINEIKVRAEINIGTDKAEVFESHLMFLEDPEFAGAIEKEIRDKEINAEKAVKNIMDNYLAIFEAMDDEYMRERAEDIKDVSMRIITNLCGIISEGLRNLKPNTILVATDLTPSDTAGLDKKNVVAFLTNIGGRTSHSAIIARSIEIPAVVGLKDVTSYVKNGDTIIVDGEKGMVFLNPNNILIEEYRRKKEAFEKQKEELKKLINIRCTTSSGKTIEVAANIGSTEDVQRVIEAGADGIGLFRTEFLYMNRNNTPSEEEQFEAYSYVLKKMKDKPVIIRTLDVGGDKKLSYLNLQQESNPFLGYRAIRLCLDNKALFKVQIRALLRATIYGNLKILFPMISGIDEVVAARNILNECKKELISEGYKVKDVEVGIMVEVPSAAIMAEELAGYVDFLSIGTNDLIQYTLAADRMNEKISYLYNPTHPAVLKLIKMTVEGAHKAGKWCGMCGEMAGDEEYIPLLVEYGLDELSMSAPSILKAKKVIMNL
jgi:phosphoenolpyruvate-protein phosphotransferase (PTS system enzyme I)